MVINLGSNGWDQSQKSESKINRVEYRHWEPLAYECFVMTMTIHGDKL